MSVKNYYNILRIPPTATPEQIKEAFRVRVKETHPDTRDRSEFYGVKEAYDVLSDPTQRKEYDRRLKLEVEIEVESREVDPELAAQAEMHLLKKRDAAYKKNENMHESEAGLGKGSRRK